jgi:serine/threonine protein kinase/tetratricopeptide (TPR) repeat protein
MGIVYRARHVGSERAVALKTVKVHAPRWLDSIRREIHALRRIQHPGVVRIVDNGVHHGRPWYAMDLLEGETLRHYGQRIWSRYQRRGETLSGPASATDAVSEHETEGPSSRETPSSTWRASGQRPPVAAGELRRVLHTMRRISATLAFLHGEGLVNCDLKPENVLLVNGDPVIIDFGLTAQHPGGSGREALETPRGRSGTLPYMAPEQIRGEFVDARSDLYAVGCMLYELLVGRPPFVGPPRSVMAQHLGVAPVRPSSVVDGFPDALEPLVLRLLAKDQSERFGYADEVAALLAELSQDSLWLPNFPPARSYIYRSRFVGREELTARLGALRDRISLGAGSMVLVGGESGVGKTRFAMELTRIDLPTSTRIVTSEVASLSTEGGAAPSGVPPLHVLRPLLRAVADRCHEGGAETTERLLGERRSVLAPYEPLLAEVPTHEPMASAPPLDLAGSRRRLFQYLAATLAAFAQDQPLIWIIDDLGWGDDLSLGFLASLSADYFETTPVFILCTHRSEDPSESTDAIAKLPHVTRLTLPRLEVPAVSSMIGDMLAIEGSLNGFREFIANEVEGNPFFVAEYLRTAVNERVLFRDRGNSWQLQAKETGAADPYASLRLPRSLRAVIEQRLRKLSPAAQQTGLSAAVMGREVDLDVLREVTGISDETMMSAIDELLLRQVLDQPEPGRLRFAHDKLREVAYAQATAEQARRLHARVGSVLEERWRGELDMKLRWATLGHHFAAGQQPERAARYLKLAGDHARATHANGDAVRLYQDAIEQIHRIVLSLSSDAAEWEGSLIELYEARADVLALNGEREDARAAYTEALNRTLASDATSRARLYTKLGKTWETQHRHEDALGFYTQAQEAIGDVRSASPRERAAWIQVHIEILWVYYWLGRASEMAALIDAIAPVVATHGSPVQQIRFLQGRFQLNLRRDRYVVTEETLGYARSARRACDRAAQAQLPELAMAQFNYGLALLLQNLLDAADAELRGALAVAQRGGDTAHQARCWTYLTLTARRHGRTEEARHHVTKSLSVSLAAGMRDYVAAANANQAWVLLLDGDLEGAAKHATEALDLWRSLELAFPLQWMALLPLVRVSLLRDEVEAAVGYAERMLAPSQQHLPGAGVDAVTHAVARMAAGDRNTARQALQRALNELDRSGYR